MSLKIYIVDGKVIKSRNSYFNKEIAKLQKIRMYQVCSEKFKDTKQLLRLRRKRNSVVRDYINKASKMVIDNAKAHNVGKIVIKYKALLDDIETEKIGEYYTSGISALEFEPINKGNYDKKRRFVRVA
ncbi:transposase [Sporosalibacterium faouarense]|uniref:transposase n=1 Tax=Sporosalibacterium faouarense TaxID=516123 RepID=UPI00141C82F1|nr:transposase [Bacillota bacterium]